LFGHSITEERFSAVLGTLRRLLREWEPTYNNLHCLYVKSGGVWEATPIPNARQLSRDEAWADMPRAAIDYLAALPEFDAALFEEITGHKVEKLECEEADDGR
jgi:hypothetical protein